MNYHNISKDDMLNGEGLRVVLWLSGCAHACVGCHNAQTWDANSGLPFDYTAKFELFDALSRDYIAGITLSGGDPLFEGNRAEVTALIAEIKQNFPRKTVWLYTGHVWEDICHLPAVQQCDVLVDGKFELSQRNTQLHWKGSANQRVIAVQKSLAAGRVVLLNEHTPAHLLS